MTTEFKLPSQPMSISSAISNSFLLWIKSLNQVLLFSFIYALINTLPYFFHLFQIQNQQNTGQTMPDFLPEKLGILALVQVSILIPYIAVFAQIAHRAHEQKLNYSQALALGLMRFFRILLFCILIFVIFTGPFFILKLLFLNQQASQTALIIFSIFILIYMTLILTWSVYITLSVPIMISENLSIIPAIKKSIALIRGEWWYTGVVLTIPFSTGLIAEMLLKLLIGNIGLMIGQAIFMPLSVATIIILYEHHKLRANIFHDSNSNSTISQSNQSIIN